MTCFALEGQSFQDPACRPDGSVKGHYCGINACVPLDARRMLDKLFQATDSYHDVRQFRDELITHRYRRTAVNRRDRAAQLAILSPLLILFLGLFIWSLQSTKALHEQNETISELLSDSNAPKDIDRSFSPSEDTMSIVTGEMCALLVGFSFWPIISALVFRGGITHWMSGLCVVRTSGRPAGRMRCAVRAALFWLAYSLLCIRAV